MKTRQREKAERKKREKGKRKRKETLPNQAIQDTGLVFVLET
jgi:hypothetical protein